MAAPNFSRTLEPLTVREHEPATFRVFYSGCPRPEVTWMRYTFPIEDSDAFQIHTTDTSSSLTILDPKGPLTYDICNGFEGWGAPQAEDSTG